MTQDPALLGRLFAACGMAGMRFPLFVKAGSLLLYSPADVTLAEGFAQVGVITPQQMSPDDGKPEIAGAIGKASRSLQQAYRLKQRRHKQLRHRLSHPAKPKVGVWAASDCCTEDSANASGYFAGGTTLDRSISTAGSG